MLLHEADTQKEAKCLSLFFYPYSDHEGACGLFIQISGQEQDLVGISLVGGSGLGVGIVLGLLVVVVVVVLLLFFGFSNQETPSGGADALVPGEIDVNLEGATVPGIDEELPEVGSETAP